MSMFKGKKSKFKERFMKKVTFNIVFRVMLALIALMVMLSVYYATTDGYKKIILTSHTSLIINGYAENSNNKLYNQWIKTAAEVVYESAVQAGVDSSSAKDLEIILQIDSTPYSAGATQYNLNMTVLSKSGNIKSFNHKAVFIGGGYSVTDGILNLKSELIPKLTQTKMVKPV
jgi:ABC-type lipoprotein release transport system permease subunit